MGSKNVELLVLRSRKAFSPSKTERKEILFGEKSFFLFLSTHVPIKEAITEDESTWVLLVRTMYTYVVLKCMVLQLLFRDRLW